MPRRLHLLRCAALVGVIACGPRPPAATPAATPTTVATATALPADRVARLELRIAPADWAAMQADLAALLGPRGARPPGPPPGGPHRPGLAMFSRNPIYVDAELRLDGVTWQHVGVRYKGNSSLMRAWHDGGAPPLRIEMDRFARQHPATRHQTLHGLEALSLASHAGDPSRLRAKLANELFAAAGLPTPATAFYEVLVDHGAGLERLGLYTASELPTDPAFLARAVGSPSAVVYKPDGAGARWTTFDAASLGASKHTDVAPARALFDALHADRTDAAAWRAGLERVFDVPVFLRWLAVNTAIGEWDAYGQMAHNYYLAARVGAPLVWLHWDHNEALGAAPPHPPGGPPPGPGPDGPRPESGPPPGPDRPGPRVTSFDHAEVTAEWPLIRWLLDDPVYRARYLAALHEVSETVLDPTRLEPRARAAQAVLAAALSTDAERVALAAGVDDLLAYVRTRAVTLRAWLKQSVTPPQ